MISSSIYSLPPELLVAIFSLCTLENSRLPIHLTHVSRHWRDVAFSYPHFWTYLSVKDARSSEWFNELLKRSDGAPLHISAYFQDVKNDLMGDLPPGAKLLRLVSRARVLELHLGKDDESLVFAHIPSPPPPFERLSISSSSDDGPPDIVHRLVADRAPLRCLELSRVKIHVQTMMTLSTLETLSIRTLDNRPPMKEFLTILGNNLGLRSLSLIFSLPEASFPEQHLSLASLRGRIVNLDNLTELSLTDKVDECANLLSHITLPAHTYIILSCIAFGSNFSKLMSVLETRFPGDRLTRARALSLWSDSYGAGIGANCDNHFYLTLDWGWQDSPLLRANLTSDLIPFLPLRHIHTLDMARYEHIPEALWVKMLSGAAQLQTLRLYNSDLQHLPGALASCRLQSHLLEEVMLAPSLRVLCLENVPFPADSAEGMGRQTSAAELLELLRNALLARRETGVGLHKLYVRGCTPLSGEDFKMFSEFIPEVEVVVKRDFLV